MSDTTGRPLTILEVFHLWKNDDTAGYDSLIAIACAMADQMEQAESALAALRQRHATVMERVRRAVNAVCSCGGRCPDDEGVCAACLVWHLAALEAEA